MALLSSSPPGPTFTYTNSNVFDDAFGPSSPIDHVALDDDDVSGALEGSFASAMSFTSEPISSPTNSKSANGAAPMDVSPQPNPSTSKNLIPPPLNIVKKQPANLSKSKNSTLRPPLAKQIANRETTQNSSSLASSANGSISNPASFFANLKNFQAPKTATLSENNSPLLGASVTKRHDGSYSTLNGRKVAGSERIASSQVSRSRPALPGGWKQPRSTSDSSHSERGLPDGAKRNSEPVVVVHKASNDAMLSSPDGMDVDGSSFYHNRNSCPTLSGTDAPAGDHLGDLFKDSTSPVLRGTTRKRGLLSDEDALPSSPLGLVAARRPLERVATSGNPFSDRASSFGRRGKASKRPQLSAVQSFNSQTSEPASLGPNGEKLSRDTSGQPPPKVFRRAYSVCESQPSSIAGVLADSSESSFEASPSLKGPRVVSCNLDTLRTSSADNPGDSPEDPPHDILPPSAGSPAVGFREQEEDGKILPCFRVKEDGLMRITPPTLFELVHGKYDSHISQFHIIDCRFDYEFEGGHINGAVNLGTKADVEAFFLGGACIPPPSRSGEPDNLGNHRKAIIVFHCEFSEKRAPTLAKHLRSKDRVLCNHVYPKIHYPEVYVLSGGYKSFFESFTNACQPAGYVRMDDPRYLSKRATELNQVRKQNKFTRARSFTFGESGMQPEPKRPVSQNAVPTTTIEEEHEPVAETSFSSNASSTLDDSPSCAMHKRTAETKYASNLSKASTKPPTLPARRNLAFQRTVSSRI